MMKNTALTFLIFLVAAQMADACSSIVLKKNDQIFLGKNFDWTYGEGMLIKNLRGTSKTAYFTHSGEVASWTSKYGSVTFNQNGKEMPYGGMNEKGLAVEMLWLESTQFNINEQKKYVNELEWIQYQLDNFQTVQEVLEHLGDLKIYPVKGKVHYIMTDAAGESVIVEYLNGKPVAYKKAANTCQTITNQSVAFSEKHKTQVSGIPNNNTSSTFRFYQLEQGIAKAESSGEINQALAFEMLKQVTIPKGGFKTVWSIVYDIKQRSISFYTNTHKVVKTIELSQLDFDHQLTYFNINQNVKTNLNNELLELTEQVNYSVASLSLIHLGFGEDFTKDASLHQFNQKPSETSVFASQYFHFEISIPMEKDKQFGFLSVMDSEKGFNKRQAVTGGYLYGNVGKGTLTVHIYGLKNGQYSMLAFIDDNKNRQLDFEKKGKAVEKYATFGDKDLAQKKDLTFTNTSGNFSRANAQILVKWKE